MISYQDCDKAGYTWTVDDVRFELGCSERQVRNWAISGRLHAVRGGVKCWRFRPQDVHAFAVTLGFNPPTSGELIEVRP